MLLSYLFVALALGIGASEASPYIVGGEQATEGEFPWMLTVHYGDYPVSANHWCGGILVNESWALTSAQCMDGQTGLGVTAGVHIRTADNLGGSQHSKITLIRYPPGYGGSFPGPPDDLAMLKLTNPFDLGPSNVGLATLPSAPEDLVGANCVIAGWGRTSSGLQQSTVLMKANVAGIDSTLCKDTFAAEGSTRPVYESNVCVNNTAQTQGAGICDGDRGGPLMCGENLVVSGIASWWINIQCAQRFPTVFTQTGMYLSWIRNVIESNK